MGLLDDAIKEHLELKRRRGADEREVSKLEHEAFGPVRGGEHAQPDPGDSGFAAEYPEPDWSDAEHEPAGAAGFGSDPAGSRDAPPPAVGAGADSGGSEQTGSGAPEPLEPDPEDASEPLEPDPGPGDTPESRAFSRAMADPDDPADLAPGPERPAAEPWLDEPDEVPSEDRLDHLGQPTAEFTPPGMELPEGAAASSDDVLEETPEFLQETPEHDRLWFEQKPPRDFDFDS